MYHYFLWNPGAGTARKELRKKIEAFCTERGLLYTVAETVPGVRIADQCRAAAQEHPEGITLYACGGDGTVGAVATGAAGIPHARVTQIPCGSGNDFLRLFGETAPLFGDLEAQLSGEEDLVLDLADVGDGVRSLNVCSVGIDARINAAVTKYKKLPGVNPWLAYRIAMVEGVIRGVHRPLEILVDGETLSGEFTLAACCNGQFYGSNFHPMPEACPDDGLLDFLVVKGVSRMGCLPLIKKYEAGRWKELPEYIRHFRCREMTLRSKTPMPVNVDGETLWREEVTFALAPEKVRFHLPAGARPIWRKAE